MSYEAPQILRPLHAESLSALSFVSGIQQAFPRQEIIPTVGQQETGALFVHDTEVAAITNRVKGKQAWLERLLKYPFPPSFFETQTLKTADADYFPYAEDGYYELGISLDDADGILGQEYQSLRKVLNSDYMMSKELKRTEPLQYVSLAKVAVLSALDEVLDWVDERKPAELSFVPFVTLPAPQWGDAQTPRSSDPDLSDIQIRRVDTVRRPIGAAHMPGPPRPRAG